MRVQNMISDRGNAVPNQFLLTGCPAGTVWTDEGNIPSGEMFQSYQSNIAYRDITGQVYLDETYWNYSRTTAKYRNIFLGENTEETRKKIKSGEYKLIDLNHE